MKKPKTKIIAFSDNEGVYGMIETGAKLKEIEAILDKYRNEHEDDYEIDGFLEALKEKIEFNRIPTEADYSIYF